MTRRRRSNASREHRLAALEPGGPEYPDVTVAVLLSSTPNEFEVVDHARHLARCYDGRVYHVPMEIRDVFGDFTRRDE